MDFNKWLGLPKSPALKIIVLGVYVAIVVLLLGLIEVILGA